MTAESGYSSHSLPSPLLSKCHKPCQSDQPQLRGCSPNPDSTQDQSSALTPRGHTCFWGSAGGRGREPHCLLQPHFPPSPLAPSPPTNPTQNLLPLIGGNSKGGRETEAGPPNTQPTRRHAGASSLCQHDLRRTLVCRGKRRGRPWDRLPIPGSPSMKGGAAPSWGSSQ